MKPTIEKDKKELAHSIVHDISYNLVQDNIPKCHELLRELDIMLHNLISD